MAGMQRRLAIVVLVLLCAVCAELLAAYDDSTGRPGELAVAVVFFALLYGCPALLLREVVRRRGLGWGAMVLLACAAGLLQAGLVDQSMFARSYGDVRGWDEMVEPTWIGPLDLSPYPVQSFVAGHVVFSFCAPIAVAEALFPSLARAPWLGRGEIMVAVGLWALVAAAILAEPPAGSDGATVAQLAATVVTIFVLVGLAFRPARGGGGARRPGPRVAWACAGGFVAMTAHALMPGTWLGLVAAVAVLASGAWLVTRWAWDLRAVAALAVGALLSRAVLAFTYFPLVGEVPAGPKYAHNVAMLALVAGAGGLAVRRAGEAALGSRACRAVTPSR